MRGKPHPVYKLQCTSVHLVPTVSQKLANHMTLPSPSPLTFTPECNPTSSPTHTHTHKQNFHFSLSNTTYLTTTFLFYTKYNLKIRHVASLSSPLKKIQPRNRRGVTRSNIRTVMQKGATQETWLARLHYPSIPPPPSSPHIGLSRPHSLVPTKARQHPPNPSSFSATFSSPEISPFPIVNFHLITGNKQSPSQR